MKLVECGNCVKSYNFRIIMYDNSKFLDEKKQRNYIRKLNLQNTLWVKIAP